MYCWVLQRDGYFDIILYLIHLANLYLDILSFNNTCSLLHDNIIAWKNNKNVQSVYYT